MDNTHTTYIYIYTPNYIIDKDIIYIYLSWITHTHTTYIYTYTPWSPRDPHSLPGDIFVDPALADLALGAANDGGAAWRMVVQKKKKKHGAPIGTTLW